MANKIVINSASSLASAIKQITEAFRSSKHLTLSVRVGRDRTLDQNALWFAMYKRIAAIVEVGSV